jgi:hypothetical protein
MSFSYSWWHNALELFGLSIRLYFTNCIGNIKGLSQILILIHHLQSSLSQILILIHHLQTLKLTVKFESNFDFDPSFANIKVSYQV